MPQLNMLRLLVGIFGSFIIRVAHTFPVCDTYSWNKTGPVEQWHFSGQGCQVNISQRHHRLLSCLQNRTMLFIGDSLTRYQYLSLVYFIATGRWVSGKPMNENERQWSGWSDFLMGTSIRLGCVEYCDCYSNHADPELGHRENRFYTNCDLNIKIGFVFWGPGNPLNIGFDLANTTIFSETCRWCSHPKMWLEKKQVSRYVHKSYAGDVIAFVREQLAHLNADMVVFNQGIWKNTSVREPRYLQDLYVNLRKAVRTGGKVVWKTTSAGRPHFDPSSSSLISHIGVDSTDFVQTVKDIGFDIFDLHALTADLASESQAYFDDAWHFHPSVYKEVNKFFLHYVCGKLSILNPA